MTQPPMQSESLFLSLGNVFKVVLAGVALLTWLYADAELTTLSLTSQRHGGESCAYPPLREVMREWTLGGKWEEASSMEENQLYGLGEAITIGVGFSERYVDGCGQGLSREPVLKLRWKYNTTSTTAAVTSEVPIPPMYPTFPRWSLAETCRALGGRWVLVVGDSLSGEFYDALVSSLYVSSEYVRPVMRTPTRRLCDDGPYPALNASYVTFDHLTFHPELLDGPLWKATASEILHHVKQAGEAGAPGTIVVLNRGAHMKSDVEGDAQPPFSHAQINAAHAARTAFTLEWFRKNLPSVPLFWRTTTVGHPLCRHTLNSPPLATPQNLSDTSVDWEALEGSDYQHRFHWDLIPGQNQLTMAQLLPPSVHLLDVAPATALRHDSHPHFKYKHRERQDCLHYCLPGPIDTWVELFGAAVRYGEFGGAEFFSKEQLKALCPLGAHPRRSKHVLFSWGVGEEGGVRGAASP